MDNLGSILFRAAARLAPVCQAQGGTLLQAVSP